MTLRAKRLGLSLTEAKEIIDLYDSPRDTGVQLRKFLEVLAVHRRQLESQMTDLQANLDEVREHEREAQELLQKLKPQRLKSWIIDVYVNVIFARPGFVRPVASSSWAYRSGDISSQRPVRDHLPRRHP